MSSCVRSISSFGGYGGEIVSLGWSPRGQRLAGSCTDGTVRLWDPTSGLERFPAKRFGVKRVTDLDWSPDGKTLACSCDNGSLVFCDAASLAPEHIENVSKSALNCVAWAPRGRLLATAGDDYGIHLINYAPPSGRGPTRQEGLGHKSPVLRILWTSNADFVVSGTEAGVIGIWTQTVDNQLRNFLQHPGDRWAHADRVCDLALSQITGHVASASSDGTIRLWDLATRSLVGEFNTAEPTLGLAFSPDGKVLVAKTLDRVAFLRVDRMEEIHCFAHPANDNSGFLALNERSDPHTTLVASENATARCIDVWEVDFPKLLKNANISTRRYCNAKVIVLGARNAGKSNLAQSLANIPFQEQHAPHGLTTHILSLPDVADEDGTSHVREIVFWDLPNQSRYELVQRMHFFNAAAVFTYDARSLLSDAAEETGLDATVIRSFGKAAFLVATKADRISSAQQRDIYGILSRFVDTNRVFVVSTQDGTGISDLLSALTASINWSGLPVSESLDGFTELRNFIELQKHFGNLLISEKSLQTAFFTSYGITPDVRMLSQFGLRLQLLQNLGLIYRLSFGRQLLLQPHYAEIYMSALISAASKDKEGLGRVPAIEAYRGHGHQFDLHDRDRIASDFERPLLSAVIEELQNEQLISSVSADGISYLVFPTQLTRELEEFPADDTIMASVSFDGDGDKVYSSLLVRALRTAFAKKGADLYHNAAVLHNKKGDSCGVLFDPESSSHRPGISVFFPGKTDDYTRTEFLDFVQEHVNERAVSESVVWNKTSKNGGSYGQETVRPQAAQIFFSYEPRDLHDAIQIADELKRRGVAPWLEQWGVRAGDDPKLRRTNAIANHKMALVALSSSKLSTQMQRDCAAFKAKNYRIIPVILPGTSSEFEMPAAIERYAPVDFRKLGIEPYDRLMDGILAAPAQPEALATEIARGHVFLSYCRDDRKAVRRLRDDLVGEGYEVWWDENQLAGENWKVAIYTAIQQAYAVVICFSKRTAERAQSGIFPEILEAIEIYKTLPPDRSVYLIPVRVSACAIPAIPMGGSRWLNTLEYVDLFSASRPKAFKRLLDALRVARSRTA